MRIDEKFFLHSISVLLRGGIFVFITLNLLSYLILSINPYLSKLIRYYSIFFLIITPLIRVFTLGIGFFLIGEKKYSFYSFLVFLIVVSGFFI